MKNKNKGGLTLATFEECASCLERIKPVGVEQLCVYSEALEALFESESQSNEGIPLEKVVTVHPFQFMAWWLLLVRKSREDAEAGLTVDRGRFERMGLLIMSLARNMPSSEDRDDLWGSIRDDIFLDLADHALWPVIESLARNEMESPICSEESIAEWSGLDSRAHVGMWLAVSLARQCRFDEAREAVISVDRGQDLPAGVLAPAKLVLDLAASPARQTEAVLEDTMAGLVHGGYDAVNGVVERMASCNSDDVMLRTMKDIAGHRAEEHDDLTAAWLYELISMVPRLGDTIDVWVRSLTDVTSEATATFIHGAHDRLGVLSSSLTKGTGLKSEAWSSDVHDEQGLGERAGPYIWRPGGG